MQSRRSHPTSLADKMPCLLVIAYDTKYLIVQEQGLSGAVTYARKTLVDVDV